MKCWSCGKKIPDDAQACRYCEAAVQPEPTAEEIDLVRGLLNDMAPGLLDEFKAVYDESKNGEDFVNRFLVGRCPRCGSSETSDCEGDPDVDDICVGRCFQCGQLWCLDCERLLDESQPHCPQCSAEGGGLDVEG
jgi:RNA polymerase subunit RPABC4/transcription elongation factor Spt4